MQNRPSETVNASFNAKPLSEGAEQQSYQA
jgi:hypothetical protein